MTQQSWWLSFVDPSKPPGSQFLGVCVVDIDEEDVESALNHRPLGPKAEPGAEWLAGAIYKAWQMACNPGGAIQASRVDPKCPVPRNRLLGKRELEQLMRG